MAAPAYNTEAPREAPREAPQLRSTLAAQVARQSASPEVLRPQLVSTPAAPAAPMVPSPKLTSKLQQLQRAAGSLRTSAIELAYCAAEIDSDPQGWQTLGFDSLDLVAESLEIAPGTLRSYLLLGSRLLAAGITLGQAQSLLTLAKASSLTKIHQTLWLEFPWIEEARMLSAKQFSALVAERNASIVDLGSGSGSGSLADSPSSLALTVPTSQRASLESRLTALRRSLGTESTAATLDRALSAAERETATRDKLALFDQTLAKLTKLWPADRPWQSGSESSAERSARLAGESWPANLTEAASHTLDLTRSLQRISEELHAVLS